MAAAATRNLVRKKSHRDESLELNGVRLTHPNRVLWPDPRQTKLDLARYYEATAEHILPHVIGRPLTLVRCPTGVNDGCFYMKHSKLWAPQALQRVRIQEKTKLGEYLVIDRAAGLLALAQMDVLEIHTWNSTLEDLEHPDRIIFDLDPGPLVKWPRVVESARLVRSVLQTLRLESFVKTTGGVGLHVVVPLRPHAGWESCARFARGIAEALVRHNPRLYTTAFSKSGRENKILIDYKRNIRTNTSVAAYSTRAKPQASISVPLAWDELSARLRSDHFTLLNVRKRLSRLRSDPWAKYWACHQQIAPESLAAVAAFVG